MKKEAKKDVLLEKAIMFMEKTTASNDRMSNQTQPTRDSDEVFGEFITIELKSINDPHLKRLTKWQIQTVLFNGAIGYESTQSPLSQSSWMPPPGVGPSGFSTYRSSSPSMPTMPYMQNPVTSPGSYSSRSDYTNKED